MVTEIGLNILTIIISVNVIDSLIKKSLKLDKIIQIYAISG